MERAKQIKKMKEIKRILIEKGCSKREARSIAKATIAGLIEMENNPSTATLAQEPDCND